MQLRVLSAPDARLAVAHQMNVALHEAATLARGKVVVTVEARKTSAPAAALLPVPLLTPAVLKVFAMGLVGRADGREN